MPAPQDPEKRSYMFSEDLKFYQKIVLFHPKENKFLAIKRSPNDAMRPGLWDLPGGNVHFGELHVDSLKREVKEEVDIDLKCIVEPIYVKTEFNTENQRYLLVIGYKSLSESDNVKLSHEHTDFMWVTKEEFLALESSETLEELVKGI